MYAPSSFAEALLLLLLGLCCWGSWASSHKLTREWRFELFYWDYSFGAVLAALISAATLGSLFGSPTAWENLRAADGSAWLLAGLAGMIWNVGNLLLMAAITLVGLSVAFPIAVGLALILGTVSSYVVMPRGNAMMLGVGVGLVFSAVIVNALAYRSARGDGRPVSAGGLVLCGVAGLLISVPGPLVARAFTGARPLASYGVMLLFTLGALVTATVMLPILMRRPVQGPPVRWNDYVQGSRWNHAMGYAGALVWATGSMLNFIGAEKVGVALAVAIGQANPLVAALWGIFVWKEFRDAGKKSHWLLGAMFVLYLLGLVILSRSQ
jgi:glucose uptake protein